MATLEDVGVVQINKTNGPRPGGGGPPGGQRIPPPPPMHHGGGGGGGQGAVRPMIVNANPGPRQQNGQTQQTRMMMQPNNNQGQQQLPSLVQERQAQQQMAMTMLPPHPPRNIVPKPLLQGPVVQISDIRKEPGRLTEAEARDELSEFVIFRFERADQATDYDSEGERVKPTWANVVRTEVHGISKKEAARRVRALQHEDHGHKSLGEKKDALTAAQQRQLEKVLEELERSDMDSRFQYVLVQIDRKLREKKVRDRSRDRAESRRHGGDSKRRGEKQRRYSENRGRRDTVEFVDLLGRRRSMVRERDTRKRVQETVSITAYYKRVPKPDVDAIAMLLQRDAHNARQLEPPHPQHTFAPQQHGQLGMHNNNHHPQMGHTQMMGMGMGGIGPQQGNKQPLGMGGNPNMKMSGAMNPNIKAMNGNNNKPQAKVLPNKPNGNNNNNGNNQARRKSPAPYHRQPRSPTSSGESMYSDYSDSYSESDSIITPNSSRSSHSHNHNHNKLRRLSSPTTSKQRRNSHNNNNGSSSRYIEEPTHFGIPPRTVTPHKQRRHDEHRITDEMFPLLSSSTSNPRRSLLPSASAIPPLAPPAPPPPRIGVDLDEIQANAYAAGRADERVDLHRERAEAAEVLRPLPRVVHHPRRSLPADVLLFDEDEVEHHHHMLPLPPSPPMGGGRMRPRVLQRRPSVRLVRPGDVALDERDVMESLERYRIEDEGVRGGGRYRDEAVQAPRYVDEYYDDVILRSERRRIEEARMRDEVMEEEMEMAAAIERDRERVERARGYLRRADSEADVLFYDREREREREGELNPFAPRPGMVRRATVAFAGRGREYI